MKDLAYYQSLLSRYKAGNCTEEEKQALFAWLTDSANRAVVEMDMQQALEQEVVHQAEGQIGERIWQRLVQQEQLEATSHVKSFPIDRSPRQVFWTWQRVAAVIIPLVTVASFWFFNQQDISSSKQQEAPTVRWLTKSSEKGKKLRLKLTDGTLVYLNSNTEVRVPESIHQNEVREVYLEHGEAFFDVAEMGTPFKVYTSDQEVMVMGTSFTVSKNNAHNKEKNKIKVAVLTGKVRVGPKGEQGEMLIRGDAIETLGKTARRFKIDDLEREFAWKDGTLVYDAATFEEVIVSLENWYGVTIVTPSDFKPKQNKFHGRYQNESLKTVLEGFAHVSGCNYEIESDTVYLTRKY